MKFKKSLCLLLVVVLATGLLYGCGGGESGNRKSSYPEGDEKTFSYWILASGSVISRYSDMGEMTIYKELEKETGVHINFFHPPVGQENEQFNLMLASRDFPDIIENSWIYYPGGPEKAIEDEVIIRLNDKMADHAPNYKAVLDSNPEYDKAAKTDAGSYFGFANINTGSYRTFGGLILRKDWLDELGLEVPRTLDEWENVLRQFKEKKGAKAPFTIGGNMFNTDYSINTFNVPFDVGMGFYLKDGKVAYGPMEEGYRQFIERMSKWYKEGLLDTEYATNTGDMIDSKIINGDSGATFGYIGSTIGRYLTTMKEKDPNFDLVAAQHPVMNVGDEPNFLECGQPVGGPYLSITTAAKYPEKIMEWADFLYTQKGNLIKNYGEEGVTYTMQDGVPTYTDLILNNPEGLSVAEALGLHVRASGPAPGFGNDNNYLRQYYQFPQQRDAMDTWSMYTENAEKTSLPQLTAIDEEADEISTMLADINTYVSEMVYGFIHGTEDLANYDEFLNQLKALGIDRVLEIQQHSYERYLSR